MWPCNQSLAMALNLPPNHLWNNKERYLGRETYQKNSEKRTKLHNFDHSQMTSSCVCHGFNSMQSPEF